MILRAVVADRAGKLYDHPDLEMAGMSGETYVRVPPDEVIPLPEGTKFFLLPESAGVGWDPLTGAFPAVLRFRLRGRTRLCQGASAFLPPGYTRTLLPATAYAREHRTLPLWAYTALGWSDDGLVAAAVLVDPIDRNAPHHYDDRVLLPAIEERLARHPKNPILRQLVRCATEYHCLPAKNVFLSRWEAPLPVASACNADCVGCLSLQPDGKFLASHERLGYVPTVTHIVEAALPHLEAAPQAIVSFGQGCEGEPLLRGDVIARAVRALREKTDRGTINLNTNGSLPAQVASICRAGLDSIRVSLNSPDPDLYATYYRPTRYTAADVVASIKTAKDLGIYTTINLLVFPGVTDREEEVEGLLRLVAETGLDMIQMRNLNIDPGLYLRTVPPASGQAIGIRSLLRTIRREHPRVEIGYVNRPKELFGVRLCDQLTF